jgi:hypothetical protein
MRPNTRRGLACHKEGPSYTSNHVDAVAGLVVERVLVQVPVKSSTSRLLTTGVLDSLVCREHAPVHRQAILAELAPRLVAAGGREIPQRRALQIQRFVSVPGRVVAALSGQE